MAAHESQMPFIRNLASSDRKLRNASLESLQNFLSTRKDLPYQDALKLWKGLYYAHWMTDRPMPQQALARDLAELLFRLPASSDPARNAIPFMQAFWAVLSMQWTDIDVLRMDKFLLLVRRVFAAQVRWAAQRGFRPADGVDALLRDVLATWCFDAECDLRRVPVGLRLHVLDLWVDELEREGALAEDAGEDAQRFVRSVGDLVEPLRTCPLKPARARAADSYDDERLPWGTRKAESDDEGEGKESGDDDEWGGIDD